MAPKQFTYLVDTYSNRLYRYIVKQGIANIDAEDMVQNCFEALWKSKMNEETESGKYLFGVAHNQCADYWRKPKRNVYVENYSENTMQSKTQQPLMQTTLHKVLLELPEEQRSLVLLKDYEGYSYEEIAGITNLNISQVKVYLHRARLKLQQKLGNIQNVI
jgi:RNA polymerase sigma factor (sigma-70 family)